MKIEDYREIVKDQLVDAWGERSYPAVQLNRLWPIVKDITAGDFKFALETLNLSSNRAPTLAQIRAACHGPIARAREDYKRRRLAELATVAPCRLCGNSGWVEAYKDNKPLIVYSFICGCESARILGIRPGNGAAYWADVADNKKWKVRTLDPASDHAYQLDVMAAIKALADKYDVSGGAQR